MTHKSSTDFSAQILHPIQSLEMHQPELACFAEGNECSEKFH